MRWIVFSIALGVLGCDRSTNPSPSSAPGAQWAVEQPRVDLGELFLKPEPHRCEFLVKNAGSVELEILEIRPSCSCTRIVLQDTSIPAGEQRTIQLLVTVNELGVHSATVTLRTNSAEEPECHLSMHWTGIAPIQCETNQIAFGNLLPGQRQTREVRLSRNSPKGRLIGVFAQTQELHVGPARESGDAITLPVTVTAGEQRGARNSRLILRIEDGWPEELPVPVTWNVRDAVEASPNPLFLGSVTAGERTRRRIHLSHIDGAQFVLESYEPANTVEGIAATWQALDDGRLAVDVDWMAPSQAGVYRGVLPFNLQTPQPQKLLVEWTGVVLEPLDLEASHADSNP